MQCKFCVIIPKKPRLKLLVSDNTTVECMSCLLLRIVA